MVVQERDRATNDLVLEPRQPPGLLWGHLREVPSNRLHEDELGEPQANRGTPRLILLRFLESQIDQAIQAVPRRAVRGAHASNDEEA
jgi:hypothetical protein